MELNGKEAWSEFPYEIKETDAYVKEQFIRDFQGRWWKIMLGKYHNPW